MTSIGIAVVAVALVACDFIAAQGFDFAAFNPTDASHLYQTNSETPGSEEPCSAKERREVKVLGHAGTFGLIGEDRT